MRVEHFKDRPAGFYSAHEILNKVSELAGETISERVIRAKITILKRQFREGKDPAVFLVGKTEVLIPLDAVVTYGISEDYSNNRGAIRADYVEKIAEAYKQIKIEDKKLGKPAGFWSSKDIINAARIIRPGITQTFGGNILNEVKTALKDNPTSDSVEVRGVEIGRSDMIQFQLGSANTTVGTAMRGEKAKSVLINYAVNTGWCDRQTAQDKLGSWEPNTFKK